MKANDATFGTVSAMLTSPHTIAGSLPPLMQCQRGCRLAYTDEYSQLERHSLQCLTAALHNLLSSGGRTSEADLVNTRVGSQDGSEVVSTAQCLDDTRREESLCQLNKLKAAIRREGRRLDDYDVTSDQCRGNLSNSCM